MNSSSCKKAEQADISSYPNRFQEFVEADRSRPVFVELRKETFELSVTQFCSVVAHARHKLVNIQRFVAVVVENTKHSKHLKHDDRTLVQFNKQALIPVGTGQCS